MNNSEVLWNSGSLAWKLHAGQLDIYEKFYRSEERKFVFTCSRQFGKSFMLCALAIEHANRIPNCQIKYAAPTQKMVRSIITPIFRQILEDCPQELTPKWFAQESRFMFPNGSILNVAGADAGNAENLRGTRAHLCIIDEAGFIGDLDYLTKDILFPMTLTTRGRILVASTPAKTPRHPFELYFKEAELKGAAARKTIYENPMLQEQDIKDAIKECGGEHTTSFKRECLALFEIDEELVVLPEFTESAEVDIVKEVDRPPYFDAYVGMDVGMQDATFILFGYWDFSKARVVIEDEIVLQGVKEVRTDLIAQGIKDKEALLWGQKKPYFRVSDVELLLINDLDSLHGLRFIPTEKDSKEAGVNELRLMIQSRTLVIHPRCKNLIAHIKHAIWTPNRDKFARIKGLGHFDGVDALIYLIRNVRRNRNPFPNTSTYSHDTHYNYRDSSSSKTAKTIQNVFAFRRKP